MKMIRICGLALLCLSGLPSRSDEAADASMLRAEMRELKTVIQSLRAENQRLRNVNDALREEIIRLRKAPAPAAPRVSPAPSASSGGPETAAEPRPAPADGAPVLYVNPHWHYLIVDRGSGQGLAKGTRGEIRRDGRAIGRAEVTDTKPGQAVLDVDPSSLAADGMYPRPGDQVVFP